MEDFYLNSRGLAGYFEAQWFDKFVEDKQIDAITSESKLVPLSFAKSSHCSQVLILLLKRCRRMENRLMLCLRLALR